MHTAWGYPFNILQNVIETTGAYTYTAKKVSAGTAGAVLASTNGSSSKQTILTGITNPDVPRVLAITIGGSGYSSDSIVINGVNVEGKPIADTIAYSANAQVLGKLVFKRVTSIVIPSTSGASMTVTIDTTNRIGLNHRLRPSYTNVVCLSATVTTPYNRANASLKTGFPIVEGAVTGSNVDLEFVEKNWAQPSTNPDGTTFLYFFYWFYRVLVYPPKDSPEFDSTTTSTSSSTSVSSTSTSVSTSSTSQSTSTSISTSSTSTSISTSSTSTSISSTSSSISSTSSSISSTSSSISSTSSSTSTSTTTLPV